MYAQVYRVRAQAELPFYCHPVYLFLAVGAVILASLEVQVSESAYPDRSTGFLLFLVSFLAFLAGVEFVRLANYARTESPVSLAYMIDARLLREINWITCISLAPIVIFNWVSLFSHNRC